MITPRMYPNKELFLGTRITRTDADGDPVECDVLVYFDVVSYSPGCPADLWGPAPHPEDPPEYEFEFDRAEFDGGAPDDAPGPLTDTEITSLKEWFEANHDRACEEADERADDGPDPDEAHDRRRDERMERAWA